MTTAYFVTASVLCAWWYRQARKTARTIRISRQKHSNWFE